jgi:hypothetical protein
MKLKLLLEKGLGYGVHPHFQKYFSYMVAVSLIGRGNRNTQRKTTDLPQVTDKLYHISYNKNHPNTK